MAKKTKEFVTFWLYFIALDMNTIYRTWGIKDVKRYIRTWKLWQAGKRRLGRGVPWHTRGSESCSLVRWIWSNGLVLPCKTRNSITDWTSRNIWAKQYRALAVGFWSTPKHNRSSDLSWLGGVPVKSIEIRRLGFHAFQPSHWIKGPSIWRTDVVQRLK